MIKNKGIFRLILTFGGMILLFNIKAQENLVPNPSFERYSECPGLSMITTALGWSSYRDSPDFFHSCATFNSSVPNNAAGYQCPATGSGYSGIYTFRSDAIFPKNAREFLGIKLTKQLDSGQKYYISFKVSLADDATYATNNIGVLFSRNFFCGDTSDFCDTSEAAPLTNYVHIYSKQIITDSVAWTTISGSFIADSTYEYIMIGNFFTDDSTDFVVFDTLGKWSYYYVDDVCVSLDSTTCLNITDSVIEFSADTTIIPKNTCINFSLKTRTDYDAFEWHFEGGDPSFSTDSLPDSICYTIPGSYDVSLIASNVNGCADTITKNGYISVKNTSHFNDIGELGFFANIFPNPSHGVFQVNVNKNLPYNIPITIYNYLGIKVYESFLLQFTNTIDIRNLPTGVYLININLNAKPNRKKIILIK